MPEMKTLTIGNTVYTIVDGEAQKVITPDNLYFDPDTNLLYLMSNGEIVGDGVAVASAGSGSGSGPTNNAVLSLKNTSGWTYKNVSQSSTCKIAFNWSSLEDGVSTGQGAVTVKVGGVLRYSASIAQGDVELDVSSYLSVGSNTIRISVSDIYGNSRTIAFTINMISLTLNSSFDSSTTYTGAITFPYTPVGAVEKTVHFILDGVEIGHATTSISGRQQTFSIPAQSHGSHTLLVYFEADIDGEAVTSNGLYYDIICLEEGNTSPIITSQFRDTDAEQYVTFAIPYAVYDPQSLTATVSLHVNGTKLNTLTVDRTGQTWSYRPDDSGSLSLKIECTGVSGEVTKKEFTINVTESQIGAEVTTEDLALYLSAYGRSNNEDNPGVWSYNDIDAQFINFNYKTDGWHTDSDGATAMRVTGDARLTIPYKMFASDFRTTGKTIEIEFATHDVLNYDAVIFSCMSGGRGLQVTTQKATLTSEQSSIGTQYKEEEHVRLSFVIEKKSGTKLLLCYINGILSGSVQYPNEDDFAQATPVDISIGSNECTTDIYNIRVYDNDLTRHQILDNWIGDTQVGIERKERYERNNVYDAYGTITTETLKKDLPYLVLVCPVLPTFKGDKKTCSGSYVDPVNPKNSFTFENAQIDVQGTSSQYYYVKNFKIKFKGGFILWDGNSAEVYQLNDKVIPTDTYTFKADVASSEGANNVVLAQIYNDLCPVKTPPQETNPKVRQTIDGHPIVIFWDNGSETKFIGKYNFNHDKGTEEVFGFTSGDESWEIRQNGTERTGFRSADFSGTDWQNDFEARYPEDNLDPTKLAALAEWLVSTNADAATNEALETPVIYEEVEYTTDSAEYRLAKFKAELADHANVDAMVYYYVITELFLCIDQREKNAFPTIFRDDPYWMMFFYDADSSLGIDNKGNLAFDYYLEDIDYTEAGDPVFNGQASVLWVNLRKCFYDKILEEYKRLRTTARSDGSGEPLISYNVVNNLFEAHQGKWSEAIYNEDGYRKSIEPYVLNGDTLYLPMLQGKKEQQRKWWLYNRFRYLDSKYNTGSSMENRITIRAHAQANIKLIAYVNMYGHVYYNAEMAEHRMYRGQEYEFVWAATGAEDAVIGVNDADLLTSLGDLSPLMVELIDISKATHLTALKVGDASEGYVNKNLNSITLGNNVLLRSLDLRNCTNLTQSVDASGCTSIEEIYLDGTAVSSVSVPNGGGLKILHLPETITNLTLRNQTALTDFTIPSYSNITTLRLENNSSAIDTLTVLNAIPESSRVRVLGFKMEVNSVDEILTFFDRLDTMRGLDENGNNVDKAQISGTIKIDSITGAELAALQARYSDITIQYNHLSSNLTFCNYDGTEIKTIEVLDGGDGTYSGSTPTRSSTAQYSYTFAGWSKIKGGSVDANALNNVTTDRNVYAVYTATVRTYTVTWKNGSTTLEIDLNVPYGTVPTYNGATPAYSGSDADDWEYSGWSPTVAAITGDTTYTAQFRYNGYYYTKLIDRSISGEYSDSSVTEIGSNAFYRCQNLTSVSFPKAIEVGEWAFYECINLTSVNLPAVTMIGHRAFGDCHALVAIDLPVVTRLGRNLFTDCYALNTLILRSPEKVELLPDPYMNEYNLLLQTAIEDGSGYIYVPAKLLDSYKNDSFWNHYQDAFRAIEDYPEITGGETV